MEIIIEKSKLTLETSGNAEISITNGSTSTLRNEICFEGVTGFNERYIKPLLELIASKHPFYKCIKVEGDLEKSGVSRSAIFFNITNLRQTAFLFATLKTLGVSSLSELRIGYSEGTPETLYLHYKVVKIISSLEEESKQQLTLYLYCLARFFYALYKVNPEITATKNAVGATIPTISQDDLTKIYNEYATLPESCRVRCEAARDDVEFDSVTYNVSKTTKPAASLVKVPTVSEYVYNYVVSESSKSLIIINKSFSPKTFYRIMGNTIYTNSDLSIFNTFDFAEWLPSLVCELLEIDKDDAKDYKIVKLPLESLLHSKDASVEITTEVLDSRLADVLESLTNISENYDMKLYEGYFKGSTLNKPSTCMSLKEQYEKDAYAQDLYKQVMPHYAAFDLKSLTNIVKGFAKGDVYSMLFEGDAGTGKSTAARVIPTRCDMPFVAFNCSTNIEEADMFGTMIPNPEKKLASDPEFIWKDGPATKAIRNGYTLIVEEINFARPGVLGKLNSLLDESRQMDLPNGEVLKAHKNFRIIATCNIAYEGTNRLNKALIDRFEICKKFEDLDQREATAIIKARTGYTDDDKISKVFNIYNAVKKYSTEQNLSLIVSIRCLLNIFKMGKYFKTAKEAMESLMLNQAFLEEPEHLKYFKDTILTAYDTAFKL